MRYPIVRSNKDGSSVVVFNQKQAYANPEEIAGFHPEAPIPADAVDPDAEPGEEGGEAKRGPGRPRKEA